MFSTCLLLNKLWFCLLCFGQDLLKIFKNEPLNGIIKQEKKEKDTEGSDKEKKNVAANGAVVKQEDQNSPLNWLADVALSSEDKKPCEVMIEIKNLVGWAKTNTGSMTVIMKQLWQCSLILIGRLTCLNRKLFMCR